MSRTDRDRIEHIGSVVVHSAIQVHRALGPGLLESAYQACLGHELKIQGLEVEFEVKVPVTYRGLAIDNGYRMDMLIDKSVVIENKAIDHLMPIYKTQILKYLELSGYRLGFLLNWQFQAKKQSAPALT